MKSPPDWSISNQRAFISQVLYLFVFFFKGQLLLRKM